MHPDKGDCRLPEQLDVIADKAAHLREEAATGMKRANAVIAEMETPIPNADERGSCRNAAPAALVATAGWLKCATRACPTLKAARRCRGGSCCSCGRFSREIFPRGEMIPAGVDLWIFWPSAPRFHVAYAARRASARPPSTLPQLGDALVTEVGPLPDAAVATDHLGLGLRGHAVKEQ
jgi:hypothetical protein